MSNLWFTGAEGYLTSFYEWHRYFRPYAETKNNGSERKVCMKWIQFRSCFKTSLKFHCPEVLYKILYKNMYIKIHQLFCHFSACCIHYMKSRQKDPVKLIFYESLSHFEKTHKTRQRDSSKYFCCSHTCNSASSVNEIARLLILYDQVSLFIKK